MVEFYGDSPEEVADKAQKLEAQLRREKWGYAYTQALTPADQGNVWKVRKAGLGLLMSRRDDRKPIAFIEDTAVDPAKLPDFLRRFREIIDAHDTTAGYYGHASVGCLHIRPGINLKEASEVDKMVAMMEEISDLVIEYGGCMSGEHGDGLARSWLNEKHFGPVLYKAFKDVKHAFDPDNRMNPGKVVDGPSPRENLRHGPAYHAIDLKTNLDFSREGGFATAIDMCNGNGECRKLTGATMCPSYMATRDEKHSTRGRANALRAILSGRLPQADLTSHGLHDVLDLCLECKACKTECPSNVDMAKLKYEFLSHYYARHGTPLRAKLFAHIATVNRLGQMVAPLANWLARSALGKWAQQRLGIAPQRMLPPFARQTFSAWFAARRAWPRGPAWPGRALPRYVPGVQLPEVGQAATHLPKLPVLRWSWWSVDAVADRQCRRGRSSRGERTLSTISSSYCPMPARVYPLLVLSQAAFSPCVRTTSISYQGQTRLSWLNRSAPLMNFSTHCTSATNSTWSLPMPPSTCWSMAIAIKRPWWVQRQRWRFCVSQSATVCKKSRLAAVVWPARLA
jgi:hypothetical protein